MTVHCGSRTHWPLNIIRVGKGMGEGNKQETKRGPSRHFVGGTTKDLAEKTRLRSTRQQETVINVIGHSGVNASSRLGGGQAPKGPKNFFLFCDLEMAYFGEFWSA